MDAELETKRIPERAPPTEGSPVNGKEEGARGRKRNRDDGEEDVKPRRRRSRKGLDKKFECPHPGCGKSYSRAEHLYRHQLNHQPKQIYYCDYPECKRSFVRQDLCTRHRERHEHRGSQLQRKDNFLNNPAVKAARNLAIMGQQIAAKASLSPENSTKELTNGKKQSESPIAQHSTIPPPGGSIMGGSALALSGGLAKPARRNTGESVRRMSNTMDMPRFYDRKDSRSETGSPLERASKTRTSSTASEQTMHGLPIQQSPYASSAPFSTSSMGTAIVASPITTTSQFVASGFAQFSLPPSYSAVTESAAMVATNGTYANTTATTSVTLAATTVALESLETFASPPTISVFGEAPSNIRSPNWYPAHHEFSSWLFEDSAKANSYFGLLGNEPSQGMFPAAFTTIYPQGAQHPAMAVNSLIETPSPSHESLLSETKRGELLDTISQFSPTMNDTFPDGFADTSMEDDRHPLSLSMMQTYIVLYWQHFHPQLPILHKPTFSTAKTPDILLLAMICLGAASMHYQEDPQIARSAADFATVIAWSLRWSIFNAAESQPPAKLWVFQALLLLEAYEKMYADRRLHERAHIHHATTLTLMRRGSSLSGRSAGFDSPLSARGGRTSSDTPSSGPAPPNLTPDEAWDRWITQEATKRVAFAAFILDSTHATMFGHSAIMAAHELRLQLPCDETLWAATNGSEVFRIQQSLTQAGVTPPSFLDGLKKILSGQPVATNSFGRTILMAGLLSASWHMHQRDIQVSSLGVASQLGGKDKWRIAMTRAFDHWKTDFDAHLETMKNSGATTYEGISYRMPVTPDINHENIFESRTVLHHLAHMSIHVDIVELQMYAGARRLLGRSISSAELEGNRRRMKAWSGTVKARDAAYYALQFLAQVLLPEESVSRVAGPETSGSGLLYSARDDHLLNRPWVLYYACLVAWAYGFASEGVLTTSSPSPSASSYIANYKDEMKYEDMRRFLKRTGNVRPEELGAFEGKNQCLGLLQTVQELFGQCRWELLVEASRRLGVCASILRGEVPG